jgi:cytochrome c-type biogenesis protein CcmH/NrfF
MNNEKLKKITLWCMAISALLLTLISLINYLQRKDMAEQQQNIDQATEFLKQIPQNASAPN